MGFTIIKASRDKMDEVRDCINSNFDLYKDISNPNDLSEHQVDDAWAERNYKIREFYLLQDKDTGEFTGEGSFQVLGKFTYIGYFYIKAGFQGQGRGKFLMQFLEERTIKKGFHDLRLFVHERATWAKDFYKKMGFDVYKSKKTEIIALDKGILKPFYEEGSLLMRKII
ncbi:MAG TPA: GNAT family N-acetyltransferase [Candidatus Lokiarchaeia archaeon]|nr:GNAT family N-acetyltransferase [Candidatus Lokiarchaeia archaeon]